MNAVKVKDGAIELPPSLAGWLGDLKELSLFVEGDTLIFKKIQSPKLSEIAGRLEEDEISMDEIVAEVHRYREENRDAGRR
jgi:hypothetical protein